MPELSKREEVYEQDLLAPVSPMGDRWRAAKQMPYKDIFAFDDEGKAVLFYGFLNKLQERIQVANRMEHHRVSSIPHAVRIGEDYLTGAELVFSRYSGGGEHLIIVGVSNPSVMELVTIAGSKSGRPLGVGVGAIREAVIKGRREARQKERRSEEEMEHYHSELIKPGGMTPWEERERLKQLRVKRAAAEVEGGWLGEP